MTTVEPITFTGDLMLGLKEITEAADDYQEAEDFYEGEPDEPFASEKLRLMLAGSYEDFRANLAKIPVDALRNRVRILGVTAPDDKAATALVEAVRKANNMAIEEGNVTRRCFEYGDAYLVVWPSDLADEGELKPEQVEVRYNCPLNTRMIYDEENPNQKRFLIRRWEVSNPLAVPGTKPAKRVRVDLMYADRVEQYISKPGSSGKQANEWEQFGGQVTIDEETGELVESWPLENPYGEVPAFHFRTDTPYGRPEHKDAYGPQNAINKLIATQMASNDSAGFPQRYGLTDPAAALESANDIPGDDDDLDVDESDGGVTRGKNGQLYGGPGKMLLLDGLKAVGQFDTAPVETFISPLQVYVRLMSTVTTTPFYLFDPGGDTNPSGESRRWADRPLLAKAADRRLLLSSTWEEMWAFVLNKVLESPAKHGVKITWAPDSAVTDTEGWDVFDRKVANGVPQTQILREAGYTDEQITAFLDDEQESMALTRRIELLSQAATAIGELNAQAALIGEERVKKLTEELLAQLDQEPVGSKKTGA